MYIVFILIAVVLIYVWAKSQKDPWVAFVKHRAANPLVGSSVLVDKIKVKEVIRGMGARVLKTYAVVGDPEQINESLLQQLPRKYIMKLNNGSGMYYIPDNYTTPEDLRVKARKWMKYTGGGWHSEMQYAGVENKIMFEELLPEENPADYKYHVIHGEPVMCQVIKNRATDKTMEFIPVDDTEMTKIARRLGRRFMFDYVRIDLYNINGNVYFGEYTFTPAAATSTFHPNAFNTHIVDCIRDPNVKFILPDGLKKQRVLSKWI